MKKPTKLNKQLEEDCLDIDPFQGDFGDGETTLSDKIVNTRKDHLQSCNNCGGDVLRGTRSRARKEACDGEIRTYRFCELCCIAMAISDDDAGKEWERRAGLLYSRQIKDLEGA